MLSILLIKRKRHQLSSHIIFLTLKMYSPTFKKISDIEFNCILVIKMLRILKSNYIKLNIFKAIKLNYFYLFHYQYSKLSEENGTLIHFNLLYNLLLWKNHVEIIIYFHKFYLDSQNLFYKQI